MKLINVIAVLIAIPLMLYCSGKSDKQAPKPNILFIAVDDLNDWVGCMQGHSQTKTPNIDRLATKGVLFTNAHVQCAICNPSRSSIMTSLYPSTTGIYFNAGDITDSPVASKHTVLTKRFEIEGYYVTGAGKIYNDNDQKYMSNYAGKFGSFGPYPEENLSPYKGVKLWDWGVYPVADSLMPDFKIAQWGSEQLKDEHDQPLFLGLGFYRPHVPLYVPQKWFDLFPLEHIQLPDIKQDDLEDISQYALNLTSLDHIEPTHEWIIKNKEWRHLIQSYLASIAFVDNQIGKVLDALDKSQFKDNTIIVLYGDNGFHLGEKERWAKQTLWEESTRALFIIAGPDINGKQLCTKPVQLLDIYPTLLELCGLKKDKKLEGHSLVPLLKSPNSEWPYMARSSFGPGNYSIRSERYRYIRYNDGSEEFYDHLTDPNEWNNLINNPEMKNLINKLSVLIPQKKGYPIIGSGSTGHKAYRDAEALRK